MSIKLDKNGREVSPRWPITQAEKDVRAARLAERARVEARTVRTVDVPYALKSAPRAFVEAARAVDRPDIDAAIARQLIEGKTVESYGIDHARGILERNLATRTHIVRENKSARIVGPQKSSSAYVNTQSKVRSSIDAATGAAHALQSSRRRLEALREAHARATGKTRKRLCQQLSRLGAVIG